MESKGVSSDVKKIMGDIRQLSLMINDLTREKIESHDDYINRDLRNGRANDAGRMPYSSVVLIDGYSKRLRRLLDTLDFLLTPEPTGSEEGSDGSDTE